nr:uncharacterized protein LOC118682562 [Bactrocera oleae]
MEVVDREKRKSAFNTIVSTNYILEIMNQRSNYTSSLRLIAWMFRFINKFRHGANLNDSLTLSPQEKELTINGRLRYLNPFLEYIEGFQILKVGGRLKSADSPEERKHLMLLPNKCEFVVHYVRHPHRKHYQAGPKALVALIRLQIWIVNARDLARRIVRSWTK